MSSNDLTAPGPCRVLACERHTVGRPAWGMGSRRDGQLVPRRRLAWIDLAARAHVLAFGEGDFCAITKRHIKR
jgi:hypothetical protein